jgi:hypothetical protein
MQFLAPHYLHLLWLGALPLMLWLYRRQARRVPVATLIFFRALAREHQESAWLRKLKRWLSLLLTLAVLLLAIFALAKPMRSGTAGSPSAVVILADVSASMAAKDGAVTRLDEVRASLQQRLRDLPANVVVSLIAYAQHPDTLLSRSRNRRELQRQLSALETRPEEEDSVAALEAAQKLAAVDDGAAIWHLSDHALPLPPKDGYTFIEAALTAPMNLGITAFQLRPAPLQRGKLEAFLQITAATTNASPMAATLELRLAGRMLALRQIELKPGAQLPLMLPVDGGRPGQVIEAELKPSGDMLSIDNAAALPLPEQSALNVAWMSDKPDPFTELALTALVQAGRVQIYREPPTKWPLTSLPDVFVFEGWAPKELPKDRPSLLLMPNSGGTPLLIQNLSKPLPLVDLRATQPDHPLLYGVSTARLSLTQVSQISPTPGLEALWLGGNQPVLLAGELQGQRVVATAFSPSFSEALALMPQYPLLLGNAIYWCAATDTGTKAQRPGDLLRTAQPLSWLAWDGYRFSEASDTPQHGILTISRIGAYETADGQVGASLLASSKETALSQRSPDSKASGLARLGAAGTSLGWSGVLLGMVLGLLLLESYLFHRKAVY